MAVVQNPLIGRSRGSVGNTTFSKWKDFNILKAKAIGTGAPNTDQQLGHRAAFKFASELSDLLLTIAYQGYPQFRTSKKRSQTEFSAMVQGLLKTNPITGNPGVEANFTAPYDPILNDTSMIFSKGPITTMEGGFVSDINIGSFTVTFDDNTYGTQALADDVARIVMVDVLDSPNLGTVYFIDQLDFRSSGMVTKSLPLGMSGKTVVIFGFFTRLNQFQNLPMLASPTAFIGPVTLI